MKESELWYRLRTVKDWVDTLTDIAVRIGAIALIVVIVRALWRAFP